MNNKNKKPEDIIAKLKATRWWEPTLKKYGEHLDAHEANGCMRLIEDFADYAQDVLNTPEESRDSLFAVDERGPYVAFQKYPAYIEPTKEEQKLDFYSAGMGRKLR